MSKHKPLKGRKLFEYLKILVTESANPQSVMLDRLSEFHRLPMPLNLYMMPLIKMVA